MDFQVDWERVAGVLIAAPAGRVDSANSADFRAAMESGIPPGERALLLDLQHLSYMSSAGLSVILTVARKFRQTGQTIAMCGLSGPIRSVVSLSGFDKIIPVHESRAAALEAFPAVDETDTEQARCRAAAARPGRGSIGSPLVVLQEALDVSIGEL